MLYGVQGIILLRQGVAPTIPSKGQSRISSIIESDPPQASITLLLLQIRNAYFVSTPEHILHSALLRSLQRRVEAECTACCRLRLITLQKLLVMVSRGFGSFLLALTLSRSLRTGCGDIV
jgi:hypothetical protein